MSNHSRRKWWPSFEVRRTFVGVLVLCLMGYTVWHAGEVTSCQTEWQNRTNTVLNDRSEKTDQWMSTQLQYLDIVAEQKRTPDERLAALDTYRAGLRAALAQRKSAPLPEEPRCG